MLRMTLICCDDKGVVRLLCSNSLCDVVKVEKSVEHIETFLFEIAEQEPIPFPPATFSILVHLGIIKVICATNMHVSYVAGKPSSELCSDSIKEYFTFFACWSSATSCTWGSTSTS